MLPGFGRRVRPSTATPHTAGGRLDTRPAVRIQRSGPRLGFMATEVADPSMRRPAVARAYPGSIVEAATLQDASPASDSVVLYTHMMCPYAQRAWLVLVEKNAPYTLVHVDLSSKPEWFLRMNPRGQVPFAALQGDAQGESLDICRWLNERVPGPVLMPADSQTHGAADALITDCDNFIQAGLSLVAANQGTRSWGVGRNATQARIQQYERACARLSDSIERCKGPYLAGEHLTLADIAYWPFMERFLACAKEFSEYDASAGLPAVQRWIEVMQQREAVQKTAPNAGSFLQAMREHECLDWFDYVTSPAMELHGHLRDEVAG